MHNHEYIIEKNERQHVSIELDSSVNLLKLPFDGDEEVSDEVVSLQSRLHDSIGHDPAFLKLPFLKEETFDLTKELKEENIDKEFSRVANRSSTHPIDLFTSTIGDLNDDPEHTPLRSNSLPERGDQNLETAEENEWAHTASALLSRNELNEEDDVVMTPMTGLVRPSTNDYGQVEWTRMKSKPQVGVKRSKSAEADLQKPTTFQMESSITSSGELESPRMTSTPQAGIKISKSADVDLQIPLEAHIQSIASGIDQGSLSKMKSKPQVGVKRSRSLEAHFQEIADVSESAGSVGHNSAPMDTSRYSQSKKEVTDKDGISELGNRMFDEHGNDERKASTSETKACAAESTNPVTSARVERKNVTPSSQDQEKCAERDLEENAEVPDNKGSTTCNEKNVGSNYNSPCTKDQQTSTKTKKISPIKEDSHIVCDNAARHTRSCRFDVTSGGKDISDHKLQRKLDHALKRGVKRTKSAPKRSDGRKSSNPTTCDIDSSDHAGLQKPSHQSKGGVQRTKSAPKRTTSRSHSNERTARGINGSDRKLSPKLDHAPNEKKERTTRVSKRTWKRQTTDQGVVPGEKGEATDPRKIRGSQVQKESKLCREKHSVSSRRRGPIQETLIRSKHEQTSELTRNLGPTNHDTEVCGLHKSETLKHKRAIGRRSHDTTAFGTEFSDRVRTQKMFGTANKSCQRAKSSRHLGGLTESLDHAPKRGLSRATSVRHVSGCVEHFEKLDNAPKRGLLRATSVRQVSGFVESSEKRNHAPDRGLSRAKSVRQVSGFVENLDKLERAHNRNLVRATSVRAFGSQKPNLCKEKLSSNRTQRRKSNDSSSFRIDYYDSTRMQDDRKSESAASVRAFDSQGPNLCKEKLSLQSANRTQRRKSNDSAGPRIDYYDSTRMQNMDDRKIESAEAELQKLAEALDNQQRKLAELRENQERSFTFLGNRELNNINNDAVEQRVEKLKPQNARVDIGELNFGDNSIGCDKVNCSKNSLSRERAGEESVNKVDDEDETVSFDNSGKDQLATTTSKDKDYDGAHLEEQSADDDEESSMDEKIPGIEAFFSTVNSRPVDTFEPSSPGLSVDGTIAAKLPDQVEEKADGMEAFFSALTSKLEDKTDEKSEFTQPVNTGKQISASHNTMEPFGANESYNFADSMNIECPEYEKEVAMAVSRALAHQSHGGYRGGGKAFSKSMRDLFKDKGVQKDRSKWEKQSKLFS